MSEKFYIRLSERGQGRTYADIILRELTKGINPNTDKCYSCNNFNAFDSACELWHERIKKKGKCDFYTKD